MSNPYFRKGQPSHPAVRMRCLCFGVFSLGEKFCFKDACVRALPVWRSVVLVFWSGAALREDAIRIGVGDPRNLLPAVRTRLLLRAGRIRDFIFGEPPPTLSLRPTNTALVTCY